MSTPAKQFYEFGEFRFDATDKILFRGQEALQLPPKALETLFILLQSGGRVLEKDVLMKAVWKDSFVEEVNLAHHISVLRKVLDDSRNGSRYIETLPRRGYRFVAPVRVVREENDESFLANRSTSRSVEGESPQRPTGVMDWRARAKRSLVVITCCLLGFSLIVAAFYIFNQGELRQPTGEEHVSGNTRYTENAEVYQLYLRGRLFLDKGSEDGLKKALEYFQQAVDIDPNYALAYAGLADTYTLLSGSGLLSQTEIFRKQRAAARKALEIDDTLAEAHASLAFVLYCSDQDYVGAEQEFKMATDLNPDCAFAQKWYGATLEQLGRMDEAFEKIKQAQELDPLSPALTTSVARQLYFRRQYDQAIASAQGALDIDPNFALAYTYLGLAYGQKGMYEKAIEAFQQAIALSYGLRLLGNKGLLGRAYALSGRRAEARRMLHELLMMEKRQQPAMGAIAHIYAGLGEKEKALQWFEKDYNSGDNLIFLRRDPNLDDLRAHPRFQDFKLRNGLSQW